MRVAVVLMFVLAVGCSADGERGTAADLEAEPTAEAVTSEGVDDAVVCEDYLGDLPGEGLLSLENTEVAAFGDATAERLNGLAEQADDVDLADALRAEAAMWDADEDFSEGESVLTLCVDLVGADRANELMS